jgi:hypothetical protein
MMVLVILGTIALPLGLRAQASLVPVHHPVYDWLYHQRVSGYLPNYAYEALPLRREEIRDHLLDLRKQQVLRGNQTRTLQSFLREFDESTFVPDGGHSAVFVLDSLDWRQNRIRSWRDIRRSDDEKHAVMILESDGFVIFDAGLGPRAMHVIDDTQSFTDPLAILSHFRAYARIGNHAGMHAEMRRTNPILGYQAHDYDRFYTYNEIIQYNLRTNTKSEGDNYVNVFGSGTYSPLPSMAFSIGRGNLKVGSGTDENLIFSREGYPFDWLRLDLGWSFLKYQMVHGTLAWQNRLVLDPFDPTFITKNSPQRFVRMHSITIRPTSWLQASAFEMLNYGNRGMEVAYLNPFNLMFFAEQEMRDQDNNMIGGALVVRPIQRIELYTELLIDDWKGPGDIIFKKKFPETSRFGRRYGAHWTPTYFLRLYTEYIRLDPFVYSHPYALNSHTNNSFSLASSLPSNADRLSTGARIFGYRESFLDVSAHYVRNGRDIFDDAGTMIFRSGWNVNVGRAELDGGPAESYLFMDGDLHRWMELHVSAGWELQRALVLRGRLEQRWMLEGSQLADRSFFWLELVIGM